LAGPLDGFHIFLPRFPVAWFIQSIYRGPSAISCSFSSSSILFVLAIRFSIFASFRFVLRLAPRKNFPHFDLVFPADLLNQPPTQSAPFPFPLSFLQKFSLERKINCSARNFTLFAAKLMGN